MRRAGRSGAGQGSGRGGRDGRGGCGARRGLWLGAALALAGCGGGIPTPVTGPHVGEEAMVIPYPPPPAKVEVVPPAPKELKRPVWVDGEWQWRGRRWVWQPGQWQEQVAGFYYAPSTAVRLADGTLVLFTGKWKEQKASR